MVELPVVEECPVGGTCERIFNNKIHRCKLYQELNNGSRECVFLIQAVQTSMLKDRVLGMQQAVEGLRNDVAAKQLRITRVKNAEDRNQLPNSYDPTGRIPAQGDVS